MPPKPILSLIIPTKDREQVLCHTLPLTVLAAQGWPIEILVINDSRKQVVLPMELSSINVHQNIRAGAASARNYGASLAQSDWLLFMDDDMILTKENLENYMRYVGSNEKITVNLDWIYSPDITEKIKESSFGRYLVKYGFTTLAGWNGANKWKGDSVVEGSGITSQNLLISKKLFLESGGYPSEIPHAGSEDHILSKKLKALGTRFLIDTHSTMFHFEIDRLSPRDWFARKVRGGETRKAGVLMGYEELKLHSSPFIDLLYRAGPAVAPLLWGVLSITSKFKSLDRVSFFCYNRLLGISLHIGYHRKKDVSSTSA